MSIYDKQNEKDMIGLLKAQRSLYNKAKAIELVKVSIFVILTCLFMVLTTFIVSAKLYSISILIAIFVFGGSYVFDYFINESKYLAAGMQQWFDIYVLGLKEPSKKYRFQKKPDLSTKLKCVSKYKDKQMDNLLNWYSNYSTLSLANQILACQKTNIRWDKDLRKKYLLGNMFLSILIISAILLIGICLGDGLKTYAILAWILPAIKHFINICITLHKDIKRLEVIEQEMAEAENIKNEKSLYSEVCDLQYYIYDHRKNALMIPNWFYNIFRNEQQNIEDNIANNISLKEEKNEPNNKK